MEDEDLIGSLMSEGLIDAGYDVLWAATGEEALAAIAGWTHGFRILVTDIHLTSDVSGLDVAHAMRERMPSIPVIVTTGRSDAIDPNWRRDRGFRLIPKPFTPSTLVSAVRDALA